ncbi:MAG: RIP metalloprotease RseP [Firmicutes bacterium HGW-Firmicutes-12]|nr:MAG: RIP metalloprotease RseP [Firmicutes bacterium HGW-Firmicutes-12]
MNYLNTLFISIIVFGIIVFVHEFGHYIVAKATGIRVEEFALGMGPKFLSKKWGETVYSLRVLPLGGFCKMSGETGDAEYEKNNFPDPRRFDQKPLWARISVVVAGPIMNFLLAVILFTLIFTVIGIPDEISNEIGTVVAGTPAESAGLLPGDKITSIGDITVNDWSSIVMVIHNNPGKSLDMTIERGNKHFEVSVVPELDSNNQVGLIGISATEPTWKKKGLVDSIVMGYQRTIEITKLTAVGLVQLFTGKVSADGIAGPVGIIKLIEESASYGVIYVVNLTALISINLGLLNLLPIPALDGSRILFLLFEGIRRRPVDPSKENFIHLIGFMLLMLLMVFITYRDIVKLFG